MRILIVDELCYPQLGGQQVRFKELAEEWVKSGNQVEIVAIDHIGNLPAQEVINGVCYNRIIHDANYYKSGRFGRSVKTIIRFSFKLSPFFKQPWDLIVFNQFPMLPSIIYKLFYKKRSKTLLDFVEHRTSAMWRFINKQIINAADGVVCISNYVKSCVQLYRKDHIYVIPSLVNTQVETSGDKSDYVFLGRLEHHKHPDHAIEAVLMYNKLYKQNKTIHLMGGGNMYDELNTKYAQNPNVVMHGRVDDEQKNAVFAKSRLLILPSEREGLPKVVIEAMAYGIPTLTTNYPGNGTQYFVAEEKTGAVAEPTIENLTEKINEIEMAYDSYVNRCLNIKHNFDLALNSTKYLNIIKEIK